MRKYRSLFLAGALTASLLAVPAALTTAGAAPAEASGPAAASALAADGNYWVWEHTNRGGALCGWAGNDADWRTCGASGTFDMNDKASSWWNNGYAGSYGDVRVYENVNYGGASTCAPNGSAGNIPWEWNDRISSHKWVNNCGY
ncbi:peptidase inhibitor family I36 protein [Streptomyces sp. NPDC007369]|uniref:peptidase inhibitor family I36 protein n=1 Tax=Streptomyces sp. NPDC007369 TaxID=3154589 RepID=UPI0034042D37